MLFPYFLFLLITGLQTSASRNLIRANSPPICGRAYYAAPYGKDLMDSLTCSSLGEKAKLLGFIPTFNVYQEYRVDRRECKCTFYR
jgi:hypothetical protein